MVTSVGAGGSGNCMICSPVFQFFPYILLLVAILLYLPSLFWRFAAAPHVCSDLKFIMEELRVLHISLFAAQKLQVNMLWINFKTGAYHFVLFLP